MFETIAGFIMHAIYVPLILLLAMLGASSDPNVVMRDIVKTKIYGEDERDITFQQSPYYFKHKPPCDFFFLLVAAGVCLLFALYIMGANKYGHWMMNRLFISVCVR